MRTETVWSGGSKSDALQIKGMLDSYMDRTDPIYSIFPSLPTFIKNENGIPEWARELRIESKGKLFRKTYSIVACEYRTYDKDRVLERQS